jgi:hypothetical protein
MKALMTIVTILCFVVVPLAGCRPQAQTPASQTPPAGDLSVDRSGFLLNEEPAGAEAVMKVRENVKHDDEVVMVGRIGGGVNPWIAGRAAFSMVDPSLKACSDVAGDNCETPWDYCCEPDLSRAMALVKVVDGEGKTVGVDARRLLNVKELSTVIVKGRAERDDAGNLTVLATGVFVKE